MPEQEYIWRIAYKIGDETRTTEERGKTAEDAVMNLLDGFGEDENIAVVGIKRLGKAAPTGKHFLKISELM